VIIENKNMIAVVSHDAGGAEIMSSWLLKQKEPYCLVLEGPAKKIFKRKQGDIKVVSLEEAIDSCNWMLCGTSWQSNLERRAIIGCIAAGKKVIAYLDHWVNYLERFQENGTLNLPDEIWVGDTYAKEIAESIFPELPIILVPNPYFHDLKKELLVLNQVPRNLSHKKSILYVCEPIREHALLQYGDERHWGYTEEEALKFFLANLSAFNTEISQIVVRPHPSEESNKYNWAIKTNSINIKIGGDAHLFNEIASSDIVVGCSSMAMVIGLLANKRVISSIPPGGMKCSLPHAEIENLQTLIHQNINQ